MFWKNIKSIFEYAFAGPPKEDSPFASELIQNGMAVQQAGRLQEAETIYLSILQEQPRHPGALYLLGTIAHQLGNNDFAITRYEQALAIKPEFAEAFNNLGISLKEQGRVDNAVTCFEQAFAIKPDYVVAQNNMGITLMENGRTDESINCFEQVLAIKPDYAEAKNNLGIALNILGRSEEAIICYEQALAIKPYFAEAHNNLGSTLNDQGRSNEAITCCEQALALRPDYADALNNLGNAYYELGQSENAITCYEQALAIQPNYAQTHSNLLLVQNYRTDIDETELFFAHQRWSQQHSVPLMDISNVYLNTLDAKRRLRIGYLSPDFRLHSVAYFIETIFSAHNHEAFEIFAYDLSIRLDSMSERLYTMTDIWRRIFGMSDEKVAKLIQDDRIDILVDLVGHTARNRMPVFAMKPAPVQVTYLGYPNTSGLATMDYRLTDKWADPPGQTEEFYTEELLRLPNGFLCYQPQPGSPDVDELPAVSVGYITFCSFNMYYKVNSDVIQVWAQILRTVPNTRLLLKATQYKDDEVCKKTRHLFQEQGVSSDRLEFVSHIPSYTEHLNLYNRVDIALDTFPYNGTTTSCEALWMGVPVVTLAGESHRSRVGTSILQNIGLGEFIAESPEAYVAKTTELASNLKVLAKLRASLRDKMEHSPLTDAKQFARSLEGAYREMWKRWCAQAMATKDIEGLSIPGDTKIVWVASMPRAGSMWIYNVVRSALSANGFTVYPKKIPQLDDQMFNESNKALADTNSKNIWILKIHNCISHDFPRSLIISTKRDLRDALVSYMRFMKCDFEYALAAMVNSAQTVDHYMVFPSERMLMLDYRDIVGVQKETVQAICVFLGLNLPNKSVERIVKAHSKNRVKYQIKKTENLHMKKIKAGKKIDSDSVVNLSENNWRVFDTKTGFQSGHISDYKDGEWRGLWSNAEKRRVEEELGPWLVRHGYA